MNKFPVEQVAGTSFPRGIAFIIALIPLFLSPLAAWAAPFSLTLALDAIEHPALTARGLQLSLASLSGGAAELKIAVLRMGGQEFSNIKLRCAQLRMTQQRIECASGELTLPNTPPAAARFTYFQQSKNFELVLEPAKDERWRLRSSLKQGQREVELQLENSQLARLNQWLPALAEHKLAAGANGKLTYATGNAGERLQTQIELAELSLSNSTGTLAAEKVAATLMLDAEQSQGLWSWRGRLDWREGEGYLQPLYIAKGGIRLAAQGVLDSRSVRIGQAKLAVVAVGEAEFSAEWDRVASAFQRLDIATSKIDLAKGGPLLIAPYLEQAGLPKFAFGGWAKIGATLVQDGLSRLDLHLDQVSVAEPNGRYALHGVSGDIPWRRSAASSATLQVGGAAFGRLPLGEFELPLKMHGFAFDLAKTTIPVLDSQLVIDGLQAKREGAQWQWQVGGSLYPLSMARLTETLGLPRMSGLLAANIPRISHSGSTISLDGALIIQVFDGYISATGLRIIEPFGLLPRLYAEVEMRHFDLGQLTETFSFGNITGFIDGDIKGLEMTGWKPLRFDARIESSPGDYRKRISQRAVENITALGGGGASAAIQRSFLRFFEEFGYSRLGLTCVLRDGVCEMGGVEGVKQGTQGYIIVKGGGVPAINVIGYNHRVDWEELVSRLKRITENNLQPVIK